MSDKHANVVIHQLSVNSSQSSKWVAGITEPQNLLRTFFLERVRAISLPYVKAIECDHFPFQNTDL